mmetsp:Transcript_13080/g.22064  ORF Transcript_13080/g.22064 Transcript_13080/m.22064 type:complete len:128 (-) Transcript_13080:108-491(-)|eukprot:CAMPEP_0168610602 /NCGR_PEP_ID=MMETSP0449_2-20121227/1878_1 /TAXON_ID=1082188 /ORGANISM="Strombidium rassoulzadegani, Strain ras09" /LENGTH=127 /DNA_ID=CAMNT_0008650925 /DNA_START=24 /DNA_END=407 /DNA_ORIENTATION=+
MQAPQQKVKAYQLRNKSEEDLLKTLTQFRGELVGLRSSKVASAPQVKLARIRVVRKAIAKVLTVLNEKRRNEAKAAWKNKKYTPKDLRVKGSKAGRSGLNKKELKLQTVRAAQKAGNFRLRKFAVAA